MRIRARLRRQAELLQTIPGVGPVTASAVAATIRSGHQFKSGREFAAWLGLTRRNHSSGGKERLGKITKMGDRYLRQLIVVGMISRVRQVAAFVALERLLPFGRGFSKAAGATLILWDIYAVAMAMWSVVLFVRELAQEAPLIVMDEPTASLDYGNRIVGLERIADLGRSRGVMLLTHDPDQALALSARVLGKSGGRMLASGPAAEVLSPTRLSQVYGVPLTVEETPSGRHVCLPDRGGARQIGVRYD